jgi:hypothetical protein
MPKDVLYALSCDARKLPIIDITNPAFTVTLTDGEIAEMAQRYVLDSTRRKEVSGSLREALERSILGRAIMSASGSFLSGMGTYLLKVGPDNLGSDVTGIDRSIAGSFPALTARLRLQDMARLVCEGLSATLFDTPNRGVCLLNIGGGPASDSWNALILLGAAPSRLQARKIVIAVLDLERSGPAFGLEALNELCLPGAPLAGLDIDFRSFTYDWSDPSQLQPTMFNLGVGEMVCAVSTEGALFEYGSDSEVVSNLKIVHACTAADTIVVGSVTREGEAVRASQSTNGISTHPRTIEEFRSLVESSGWALRRVIDRPFSYNVCLVKHDALSNRL